MGGAVNRMTIPMAVSPPATPVRVSLTIAPCPDTGKKYGLTSVLWQSHAGDMSDPGGSPTFEEFTNWVRQALDRLYDVAALRTHPLITVFPETTEGDSLRRCQQLRRILLDIIHDLRPAPGVPVQSPDWRTFRILELRYIEGLSPDEAAERLTLSRSQLFRDQARALEIVASTLWDLWHLGEGKGIPAALDELITAEAERLSTQAPPNEVSVTLLLGELEEVLGPLAAAQGAELEIATVPPLPGLCIDRVILRQAILGLATQGLGLVGSGRVTITPFASSSTVRIRLRACPADNGTPSRNLPSGEGSANLCIATQLATQTGGTLHTRVTTDGCWEATLWWPRLEPASLLVVDDNEDLAELFRLYLQGTRWYVSAAASGAEAWRLIGQLRPTAITLDVLMPREDGWELLMRLKGDDATRPIPVIVCSVLDQPGLALSLGATTYLPKPVSQRALLEALAHLG